MTSASNTLLVVLGKPGRLRSVSLEIFVTQVKNRIFVDPVKIKQADRNAALVNERLSEVLLGKRLSDSELGCAIAHKNARAAAIVALKSQINMKWALFVEDDADLNAEIFNRIHDELENVDSKVPTLVNYDSRNQNRTMPPKTRNLGKPLLLSRFWYAGAVCYAVNREGLQHLRNFTDSPIDFVADWPVYYSRLKLFVSNRTWVYEVKGQSSIGIRHNLKIGKRLMMHIRQVAYLRKLSKLYGVTIRTVVRHLIITPLIRDSSGRLLTVRSQLSKLIWNRVGHRT